jgi:AAA+ superfamily predicted ATPase
MDEQEARTHDAALEYARAHKKTIAKRLANPVVYPPEECPVSIFMAGSPGAGKTETSKALIDEIGGTILRIDPDELRGEFDLPPIGVPRISSKSVG